MSSSPRQNTLVVWLLLIFVVVVMGWAAVVEVARGVAWIKWAFT